MACLKALAKARVTQPVLPAGAHALQNRRLLRSKDTHHRANTAARGWGTEGERRCLLNASWKGLGGRRACRARFGKRMGEGEEKMTWQGQDADATLGESPVFSQLWNAEFCSQGTAPCSQLQLLSLRRQRPQLLPLPALLALKLLSVCWVL